MASTKTKQASDFEAFNQALDAFMLAIRRARGRFGAEAAQGELSLSQFQLLDPLDQSGGPLPVGEVALGGGIAAPTATRMLDILERDGYVERVRVAGDRRLVHVRITERGTAAVAAKRAAMAAKRAQVFASLPAGERREAARVLARLADAVEELR
jgi:DNA-binding MarR family transcriptional regulator